MRNLREPIQNKVWYDKFVNSKTEPLTHAALSKLKPSVVNWYKAYCTEARNGSIDSYNLTSALPSDWQSLQDCYDNGSVVMKLKEYIRGRQEKHLRRKCQYCMVGISDTFDHYLPQTPFPEFSILSNNLLPACDYCNRKKWAHWKNTGGERIIFNLYYDIIPTQQFLYCTIKIRNSIPIAEFECKNLNSIPSTIYDHIIRHFDQLEVITRIHSVCDSEIATIGIELSGLLTTHSLTTVSTFLLNQAADLKIKFGNNYCWAVLKEAMANNINYLKAIGFV